MGSIFKEPNFLLSNREVLGMSALNLTSSIEFGNFLNPAESNRNVAADVTGNVDTNQIVSFGGRMNSSFLLQANTSQESNMTFRLPKEMQFTDDNLFSVVSYCILFLIAACGNLTVFITLFRNRHRKSRVNLFIMHLCIADLVVTFIMMPLEIVWQSTVSWRAGEGACRILMFFRAFGFYLSSFILVCISLDRYFAILKPLSISDADKRGRIMLTFAWLFSIIASIPQSVIFHIEAHPNFAGFTQCVTFNFFPSQAHELAYNIFNFATIYVFPLIVIIVSYAMILNEINKKTKEHRQQSAGTQLEERRGSYKNSETLRRSGMGKIQLARIRTLKMTLMIVFVFIVCWTPYYVISVWWWFDYETANKVSPKVQRGLFLFAVSSCCMDPIVYGMFTIDFTREFQRCCCLLHKKSMYQEVQTHSAFSRSDCYKGRKTYLHSPVVASSANRKTSSSASSVSSPSRSEQQHVSSRNGGVNNIYKTRKNFHSMNELKRAEASAARISSSSMM